VATSDAAFTAKNIRNSLNNSYLTKLGFSFEKGGAHIARTMMLTELCSLLASVDAVDATKFAYQAAIEEDNCLAKRSTRTRRLSYRHLVDLYSLDTATVLFRALRYFWQRDQEGQPLLALLCAFARDAVLRDSAPLIAKAIRGAVVSREEMEEHIDRLDPGRFSEATLKSTAQNVNSTWTQSGHLSGRARKVRSQAQATPGSTAYALLLGYLTGTRGDSLFRTDYAKLLDCPFEKALDLAELASRKGWIQYKRIGDVIEVLFPNLLTKEELERLREQN
jgi:hypothetical protein